MLVLDNTSFGVQLLTDVNVALYVALETCGALPLEEAKMSMPDVTPGQSTSNPRRCAAIQQPIFLDDVCLESKACTVQSNHRNNRTR